MGRPGARLVMTGGLSSVNVLASVQPASVGSTWATALVTLLSIVNSFVQAMNPAG